MQLVPFHSAGTEKADINRVPDLDLDLNLNLRASGLLQSSTKYATLALTRHLPSPPKSHCGSPSRADENLNIDLVLLSCGSNVLPLNITN